MAGGYGTGESDWLGAYDVFEQKAGYLAESWSWTFDAEADTASLVYQIRPGMYYALNPSSEAANLVGGRELTADDVVDSFRRVTSDTRAYMYRAYRELRNADIQKTGPWEVTVNVPFTGLITAIAKFGNYVRPVASEVVAKYGDTSDWRNSVGTGPFILKDYIAGSAAVLERNPDYWGTDPIGPGEGNPLPYVDGFQYLIIPDTSTQQAALRTGKIDRLPNLSFEDAATMRKSTPELIEGPGSNGGPTYYVYMNSQREPFNNKDVRRALFMSVDLESIRDSLNHGLGQILTWPIEYIAAYSDNYLGLDDPEMPESVKELYVYNPDKAKELLSGAGYPNGFKTTALIAQTEVDYFSIIKDMWAKVGVELELDVRDTGTRRTVYGKGDYDVVGAAGGRGPVSVYYHMVTMVGDGPAGGNGSNLDDPILDAASEEMQRTFIVDGKAAAAQFKDLMKYVLDQAYVIPRPIYAQTNFWWPWLKNYSGERLVGYYVYNFWSAYIWIDEDMKKEMGF